MANYFYNKTISILGGSEGYTDEYGLYHEGESIIIEAIPCDVQPYSADLLKKEYGYNENVTKRIFCDINANLETGKLIAYNDNHYIIQRIIEWDDYLELMVQDYE